MTEIEKETGMTEPSASIGMNILLITPMNPDQIF